MKFKMRVFHYPEDSNVAELARAIAKAQKTTSDSLPLNYDIENERLLFLGLEVTSETLPTDFADFCKTLTPERARNVALFYTFKNESDEASIHELRKMLIDQGIKVFNNTYRLETKGRLFRKAKVTGDDIARVADWSNVVVGSMTY